MKKVGILTFHRSRNYGAVLQAYALAEALRNLGCEPEIIDYCCLPIKTVLKLWNPSKNLLHASKQFVFRFKKKMAFDRFIDKWSPMSRKKNIKKDELEYVVQKYDYLFAGSDQIWNVSLTNNDGTYFLDFDNLKAKKIAYAASAGDTIKIDEDNIDKIRTFSAVSVREKVLEDYLKTKDISSTVCCDPTLLLEPSIFLSMASRRLHKKRYLFLFMIWESEELISLANDYARKNDCIVISNKKCTRFFLHCKPEDFLSWIYYAEGVLTNSFHASVFSLKFHKPLLADIRKADGEKNNRIAELLLETDCRNCVLDNTNCISKLTYQQIDYNAVDRKLQEKRESSMSWIKDILFSEKKSE